MSSVRKTIFISDLHLDEQQPLTTEQFLSFLKKCDKSVEAIYILGDLFEAWVGDDDDTLFHQKIICALKAVTERGIPIYFLHGNRDFLIGKKFLQATGCELIQDEEKILLYGKSVLLMHGDTLCTRDVSYLKARKIFRQRFLQQLFLLLPLYLRKKFSNQIRLKSMQHTHSISLDVMDVTQAEVQKVMQKYQVQLLIHGHTHRPAIHSFTIDQQPAERIVLGAWHDDSSQILIWDESGKKELIDVKLLRS